VKYIIFTADIHGLGGMQYFDFGKSEYLRKKGYQVYLFYSGSSNGNCAIKGLNQYLYGGINELSIPPYKVFGYVRRNVLKKIKKIIGSVIPGEEVWIESHKDPIAQWAELLAEDLNVRHVIFCCSERLHISTYYQNLDFYDFKHKRKEFCGESYDTVTKLFDGYKEVKPSEHYIFTPYEESVYDYDNSIVNKLKRDEWNICYIGRITKLYVPQIINDVGVFAKRHAGRRIQFLIVGDASAKKEEIRTKLYNIPNLKVTELGDLIPIPRKLFSFCDVVIAGSGSAKCAVYEGVPVIVCDAWNGMSDGVLGYETMDALYHDGMVEQSTYDISLEKIFVEKLHEVKEFKYPKRKAGDEFYQEQLDFIKADFGKKYYTAKFRKFDGDYAFHIKRFMVQYLPLTTRLIQDIKKSKSKGLSDGDKQEMGLKERCRIINFSDLGDERGKLVVIEGGTDVPFDLKRVFYIYGSDSDVVRGQHANRQSEFVLINVAGESKVKITDGKEELVVKLNRPMMGVYIPKMVWKDMYDFSPDSVLLVLASTHYDGNEYIRDYDEYIGIIEGL